MTLAQFAVNVPLPPEQVWAAVSDFKRWDWFFVFKNPGMAGWGDRFEFSPTSGSGAETRLEMLCGQKRVMDWAVEEWSPPQKLRIKTTASYDWFFRATRSALDILITPGSAAQSMIELRLETEFSAPVLGYFLNEVVPLKKTVEQTLMVMGQVLQSSLSRPQ